MKEIYLDYAASTPVRKEVLDSMLPYFSKKYGNPSSIHSKGLEAKKALDESRKTVAKILNCTAEEIIFTSSGTESINLAIKGLAFQAKKQGKNHIITSEIEHPSVLDTCKYLEKNGFNITYLNVDSSGLINPENVKKAINDKTALVSIMYANNEIGTIEPIKEIGKICKDLRVPFHTDACQAAGFLNIKVDSLNIDLLSLNGSKIYGPKGSGILYIKKSVELEPLIHGGGQEKSRRSGTENIPAIIGFAKALEIAQKEKEQESKRLSLLRDLLISNLLKISKTKLNSPIEKCLPNNINITFLGVEGESILLLLDRKKIYASTSSACTSKSLETSHVLKAIGAPYDVNNGSIRFSLGKYTKKSDILYVSKIMPEITSKLRKI